MLEANWLISSLSAKSLPYPDRALSSCRPAILMGLLWVYFSCFQYTFHDVISRQCAYMHEGTTKPIDTSQAACLSFIIGHHNSPLHFFMWFDFSSLHSKAWFQELQFHFHISFTYLFDIWIMQITMGLSLVSSLLHLYWLIDSRAYYPLKYVSAVATR